MQLDQQSSLDKLKDQSPDAWLEYIQLARKDPTERTLSMDVIYHYIVPRVKQLESVEWAEVAICAVELEAERSSGPEREDELLRAMKLRSWLIALRGSVAGHFVLDKEAVLRWVDAGLCYSIEGARQRALSIWAGLERATKSPDPSDRALIAKEISQLRWIKHRLDVAQILEECGELPADSTTRKWLEIREQLP